MAAKKPSAKKPSAKKTSAKKTSAKKTSAKKPSAKKPSAKKPSAKKPSAKTPATIDDYLRGVSQDRREALEKLRRTIHKSVAGLEECISYSMPAFRKDGKVVAGFIATGKGCSYLPFSGTTLGALADELADYDQTKSALHFDPKRGLPASIVKKLLAARIAENTR